MAREFTGNVSMRAALLSHTGPMHAGRLIVGDAPRPQAGPGRVLLRLRACGVCRTDLHIAEGDLPLKFSPLIPGHQIVGDVVDGATKDLPLGTRGRLLDWRRGWDLLLLPRREGKSLRCAGFYRLFGERRLR